MLYRTHRGTVCECPARGRREGSAMIEFAFVAPILFMLLLGIFELGRGLMVTELLTAASRIGAHWPA